MTQETRAARQHSQGHSNGHWEKATLLGTSPGSRFNIDAAGIDDVRILSPSFRKNDGVDYGYVGQGVDFAPARRQANHQRHFRQ